MKNLSMRMKTLTCDGEPYHFSLQDIPVLINRDEFVLLNKPGSPRLNMWQIRRGDEEYDLYDGDLISMHGDTWVVCYERGFYAINEAREIKYLDQLRNYEFLSGSWDVPTPVPVEYKKKHKFKYKDFIFGIDNIVGMHEGKIMIRTFDYPIDAAEVQQECSLSYGDEKLYFGDMVQGCTVELYKGRVAICKNGDYIDLATEEVL